MLSKPRILSLFPNSFNKFNKTRELYTHNKNQIHEQSKLITLKDCIILGTLTEPTNPVTHRLIHTLMLMFNKQPTIYEITSNCV